MFAMMEAARLEELHLTQDPATGLKAIIAIHNTRLGPALGGCRYLAYPDEQSAIRDAVRLAQGMSYKAALAGLDQGGGKAVIIRPAHVANRGALFEAFGRFIETLNGRYITAVDSGTSTADDCCCAAVTRLTATAFDFDTTSVSASVGRSSRFYSDVTTVATSAAVSVVTAMTCSDSDVATKATGIATTTCP